MRLHHLDVTRSARYFALGPEDGSATELWIGLHGYAQLASRFLRWLAPLEDGRTLIAAPEALSRFYLETGFDGRHGKAIGATWLTREDREADLLDHLRYLDRLLGHLLAGSDSRPRLGVLGFSQGAALAARWVAEGRVRPAMLVLWGAPPPEDVAPVLLAERLEGRPLHLVAGDRDSYLPPGSIEGIGTTLRSAGAAVTVTRFHGGHEVDGETLVSLRAGLRST
jgi:predicted esterase